MAVLGHNDSGKSTVADDLENEAANAGWESSKYAWIFDNLETERESGDTIDVSLGKFETDEHVVTLIDCPGRPAYTKNMITGAVGTDCALLVVSAAEGEFEAGLRKDHGQMREHAQLAFTLGVKRIIVAITKMDTCGWSERRYNEIVDNTRRIIVRAGYNGERTPYVPVSGLLGDNISTAIESWYNGWPSTSGGITEYPGKSLLDAMNYVQIPGKKTSCSFRLPIRNVYSIPGAGTVVTGTVVEGSCWPGMYVTLAPNNIPAQVQSIQQHHEDMDECTAGDVVGLCLGDTDTNGDAFNIRRGEVVSDSDDPASNCSSFTAQIIITNHPGWIKSGYMPSVHCGTGRAPCRFDILHVLDRRTGCVQDDMEEVKLGDAAMVRMTPYKPFSVEAFKSYPALGRVVVRDSERTVAVGTVQSVERM